MAIQSQMWDLSHRPWTETVEREEPQHPSEQYFLLLMTGESLVSGFWFTQTAQVHSETWPLWSKNNGLYLYQTWTNIYTLSPLQLSECKDKVHTVYCLFMYSFDSSLHGAYGTHLFIVTDVVFRQRSSIPSQRTLHSTHVKTLTIHPRLSATCVLNAKCAPLGKKKISVRETGFLC